MVRDMALQRADALVAAFQVIDRSDGRRCEPKMPLLELRPLHELGDVGEQPASVRRDGSVVGMDAYALSKRTPSPASRSMFGVLTMGCPAQPRVWSRWSSA